MISLMLAGKSMVEKKVTECSEMSSLQKDKIRSGTSYADLKGVLKPKTGGNDGLIGELFKYGGKRMANLLKV